jgi:xanthine dehydrogenase iron-sulfur cluster and FAD-binding subunit A
MDAPHNQVFFPVNLQELFAYWTRFPDAVPFAGGTSIDREQNGHMLTLPVNILSLNRLEELRSITRTERYIEIGAMVTLNEIINMGKVVPTAFTQALKGIAGPELRNLATIGGNICHAAGRLDSSAPLIALDARFELRTAAQSRWISASRFSSLPGPPAINPKELLTRIRIPLEQWNYSRYRKFTNHYTEHDTGIPKGVSSGGAIVFLARIQKNILTDIRAVFAGEAVLRDKNSENILSGTLLPLDRSEVRHFVQLWETYLAAVDTPGPMMRTEILNYIESCIMGLAD